jgi:hypothetical protein
MLKGKVNEREVSEFPAAVKLDAIKPEVDGGLNVALVVVDAIVLRAVA